MRSARSGSSLMAKMPRLVGARGRSGGQLVGEVATLGHLDRIDLADEIGDRRVGRGQLLAEASSRCTHSTGVSSPASAPVLGVLGDGLVGSSLISDPATIGIHSVEQTGDRADHRLLACPRSPRKISRGRRAARSRAAGARCPRSPAPREEGLTGRMHSMAFSRTLVLDGARTPSPMPGARPASSVGRSCRSLLVDRWRVGNPTPAFDQATAGPANASAPTSSAPDTKSRDLRLDSGGRSARGGRVEVRWVSEGWRGARGRERPRRGG